MRDGMNRPHKLSVLCLTILASLPACAREPDVEFDTDHLLSRGLSPRLAEDFREGDRFPPGENLVTLVINNEQKGRATVRFSASGQPCWTEALSRQGRLDWQNAEGITAGEGDTCLDPKALWPQTDVISVPGEGELQLVVPPGAVLRQSDYFSWDHGGQGVLLNYSAQYMKTRSAFHTSSFRQAQTEAGFNVADWIVRSTQNWSDFSRGGEVTHQNAWVQKTLFDHKAVFQAGRINFSAGNSGGGRILGMQMTPEAALYDKYGAAVVSGVADEPSVVEIRQQNILLYQTSVPSGPFELRGFSLLNLTSDLEVTVVSNNGSQREFRVPSAAYVTGESTVMPGLAWGLGRWDQDGSREKPFVAGMSKGWQLLPRLGLQTDAFLSGSYQAATLGMDTLLPAGGYLSLRSTGTLSGGTSGVSVSTATGKALTENVSLNLHASWQGQGYREFSETLTDDSERERSRAQYGPTITWSHPWLGSSSVSWVRSVNGSGRHTDYAQLSWTRRIAGAYLSITAGRNTDSLTGRKDDRIYGSLQIPFGEKSSLTGYVNNAGNQTRFGSRYTVQQSRTTSWGISAERSRPDGKNAFTGMLNTTTTATSLGASVSASQENNRSLSLQGSGSVLLHENDLLFSPYRIADTFGIARVEGVSGVKIDTPAGPVWTNRKGKAVVPSLQSWQTSTLHLDNASLKKGTEVSNASEEIRVARGAVSQFGFSVVTTRRVLVRTRMAEGQPLPARAAVYSDAGQFISVTGEDGSVFVENAHPGMTLEVQGEHNRCLLRLNQLPEKRAEMTGLYEETSAVCR